MIKKILTGALFLIFPIIGIIVFGEVMFYIYHEEIMGSLKMMGSDYIIKENLKFRWGYIVLAILLIMAYRLMGKKVFILSWIFWTILAVIAYVIFGRSIDGLEEIDNSAFQHSKIDWNNIPSLKEDTCNSLKEITDRLDKKIGSYFTVYNDTVWKELLKNNNEHKETIEFLYQKKINFGNTSSPFSEIHINKEVNYIPFIKPIINDKYTLVELSKLDTKIEKMLSVINQEQIKQATFYQEYKNKGIQQGKGIIDLFYTEEEKNDINKLITIISELNTSSFGYCIKQENDATLLDSLFPKMTYMLKTARILANYSLLQTINGNTLEAFQAMKILTVFIKHAEENTTTLVSMMINLAMKGVLYGNIEVLDGIGFPKYYSKILIKDIASFDEIESYSNGIRGEYLFLSSLGGGIKGSGINSVRIPVIFDGKETDMVARNISIGVIGDMYDTFKIGKYHDYQSRKVLIGSDVTERNFALNNIMGNILLKAVLPTYEGFSQRVLGGTIWKNTLIKSFE